MEQFRWENSWVLILVGLFDLMIGGGITFMFCNAYDLKWNDTISLYLLYTICIGVIGLVFLGFLAEVRKTPRDHSEKVKYLICGITLILWPVLCILLCYQAYLLIIPSSDDDRMKTFIESLGLFGARLFFIVLEGLVYNLEIRKYLWNSEILQQEESS